MTTVAVFRTRVREFYQTHLPTTYELMKLQGEWTEYEKSMGKRLFNQMKDLVEGMGMQWAVAESEVMREFLLSIPEESRTTKRENRKQIKEIKAFRANQAEENLQDK